MEDRKEEHRTKSKQLLLAELLANLCRGISLEIPPERILFYCEALDDLSETQLRHGFALANRNIGEFLPSVAQLREWCESWRPPEPPPPPALEKSDLVAAGNRLGVTHEQVMQWLEEGKRAQQQHYENLKADPAWQAMVARLNPKPKARSSCEKSANAGIEKPASNAEDKQPTC